jgi:hypothetical protein
LSQSPFFFHPIPSLDIYPTWASHEHILSGFDQVCSKQSICQNVAPLLNTPSHPRITAKEPKGPRAKPKKKGPKERTAKAKPKVPNVTSNMKNQKPQKAKSEDRESSKKSPRATKHDLVPLKTVEYGPDGPVGLHRKWPKQDPPIISVKDISKSWEWDVDELDLRE